MRPIFKSVRLIVTEHGYVMAPNENSKFTKSISKYYKALVRHG